MTRAIFCLHWRCDVFQKLPRHRRTVKILGEKRNENRRRSHPRRGDATAKNIVKKIARNSVRQIFRDKGLACRIPCAMVATRSIFTACWRRDIFETWRHLSRHKIARVGRRGCMVLMPCQQDKIRGQWHLDSGSFPGSIHVTWKDKQRVFFSLGS